VTTDARREGWDGLRALIHLELMQARRFLRSKRAWGWSLMLATGIGLVTWLYAHELRAGTLPDRAAVAMILDACLAMGILVGAMGGLRVSGAEARFTCAGPVAPRAFKVSQLLEGAGTFVMLTASFSPMCILAHGRAQRAYGVAVMAVLAVVAMTAITALLLMHLERRGARRLAFAAGLGGLALVGAQGLGACLPLPCSPGTWLAALALASNPGEALPGVLVLAAMAILLAVVVMIPGIDLREAAITQQYMRSFQGEMTGVADAGNLVPARSRREIHPRVLKLPWCGGLGPLLSPWLVAWRPALVAIVVAGVAVAAARFIAPALTQDAREFLGVCAYLGFGLAAAIAWAAPSPALLRSLPIRPVVIAVAEIGVRTIASCALFAALALMALPGDFLADRVGQGLTFAAIGFAAANAALRWGCATAAVPARGLAGVSATRILFTWLQSQVLLVVTASGALTCGRELHWRLGPVIPFAIFWWLLALAAFVLAVCRYTRA
jgi:hypothetical protein